MQFIQTRTTVSNTDLNNNIETPTKKTKKQYSAELNTADSIVLTDQKPSSFNQIDAQQLFQRFHQIVKISEFEEESDQESVPQNLYRKLDYEAVHKKAIKLDFSPFYSSMSKQNKIHNGKCSSKQMKGKQLFEIIQVNSPRKTRCVLQSEVKPVYMDNKIVLTPSKKQKQNLHCQMTARKQSPYRDLVRKL